MQAQPSSTQSNLQSSNLRLLAGVLLLLLVFGLAGMRWLGLDNAGLGNGFSHPLDGWDHLVTMLAVGIWAAQLRGQAVWMLPLTFVGVMSLGGLAGAAGIAIPSIEGIILLSCVVFAVLISRNIRFSRKVNVLIVAFFAFFHGFAHGQEISTSASLVSYTLGFMLATLLLHGAGILVAKLVVLAATCLLTLAFSQTAFAKTDHALSTHDNQATLTGAAFQDFNSANHWRFAQQDFDSASSVETAGLAGEKRVLGKPKPADGSGGFAVLDRNEPAAPQPGFLRHKLFDGLAKLTCLSFKHLFPDINQTPGTQLLSNGVGRTSPPLFARSQSHFAVFKSFRSSPASPIIALRSEPVAEPSGTIKCPVPDASSRSLLSLSRVKPFYPILPSSPFRASAHRHFHSPFIANFKNPASHPGLYPPLTAITTITAPAL